MDQRCMMVEFRQSNPDKQKDYEPSVLKSQSPQICHFVVTPIIIVTPII